jgi:hypothetical protein
MRNVVGILLAAAVGIHCSAPAESPEASSAPELVASPGAAQTEAPQPPAPTKDDPTAEKVGGGQGALAFSPLIPESATTHVTSTVTDATGASYATGTFEGGIVIGRTAIQSRGDKDVFLLKTNPQGEFQWLRAVGSASTESGPRVTLEEGSARVQLLGMTKGRMDCGAGPLPTWSSETFFFCIFSGADGAAVSGGVFPTGAP